jgi:hypothetical protein
MATVPDLVIQAANDLGVPPQLALEVASAESGFDQDAVSSAGAIGVMQLMPATAAQLGVDPTDLTQNVYGGVTYLGQMLSMFGGDPVAALAAYNWGPGRVQQAQSLYGAAWFQHIPSSVQRYVQSILGTVQTAYSVTPSVVPFTPAPAATPAGSLFLPTPLPSPATGSLWPQLAIAAALLFGVSLVFQD